ncbi:MAG: hypothetical protein IPH61_02010 [Bacteroidetes bacterium]|nr:hypothetical protein [Bacteroidota bacterium]
MKKLLFLICSFYIAIFSVSAQERLADPRLQFANTITAAELKTHLSIIASDEYEGRGTATKGQQMAAEYISNYYKSIGIPPLPGTDSYYQKFELMEIGLGDMQLNIGKEKYQFIRDFYAFPNSSNSADIQSTEIIFLGYGIDDSAYSDYKNIDVAGKVIVVLQGEPKQNEKSLITGSDELSEWSTEWDKKIETATQHQVKCIFIIDEEIERVASSKYFVNYLTSSSLKLKKDYTPSPFCAYAFIAPHVGDELLDGKN